MNKKYLSLNPIFLAVLLYFFFYFLGTNKGMNFTVDSRQYLNVAEQIYQNGFRSIWKNEQLVYWPPLFPLALSVSHYLGGLIFVKFLHFSLGVSLIVLWGKLSYDIIKRKNQRYIFMVLLALSTHLMMVFVWSELMFMVLLGIFLICIQNYVNTMEKSWLLASIAPAFLMMVERNAGIFIYAAIVISMICFKSFSKKTSLVCGFDNWDFHIWIYNMECTQHRFGRSALYGSRTDSSFYSDKKRSIVVQ